MQKILIPLLLGLSACGSGETEFMWGEASERLSADWCEARERCLSLDEFDRCWRHNMHHLCELEATCETPVPEAEPLALRCEAELEEIESAESEGCIRVIYGVVPPACGELLGLMPVTQ